jgi:pyridoxal phosphate enzyme (YggS family)
VDSLRLAEELHNFGARTERTIEVLLQVNVSGEASKAGVAAPAVIHLAEQIDTMMHLKLRGLMTMAPAGENPEDSRPVFARTAELFHDVRSAKVGGPEFNLLSMGMTSDYEVAIEEGANLVRIGRAIFGDEEQPELPG